MPETLKITSRSNERLVRIRKVRDAKEPGLIFVEGLRLAEETLRSGVELVDCVFAESFANSQRGSRVVAEVCALGASIIEVPDDLFKSVAETRNSQGIVIVARRPESFRESFEGRLRDPLQSVLYFHETNDPSNLGAIFRTAEAAGVSGVILSKGSADAFSPKALRAGMGANLRIPVWEGAETGNGIEWARSKGFRIVAADIKGSVSYASIDWTIPSLLIFGSEAHGLGDGVLESADEIVSIPMKNGVESLNLAVSAGIILFEAVRQNT